MVTKDVSHLQSCIVSNTLSATCACFAGTKLSDKFSGVVTEVVSGDTIVVKDAASKVERRVNLSSIRAPRIGRREDKPEDWALEAKEFLRQRLIGVLSFSHRQNMVCDCCRGNVWS